MIGVVATLLHPCMWMKGHQKIPWVSTVLVNHWVLNSPICQCQSSPKPPTTILTRFQCLSHQLAKKDLLLREVFNSWSKNHSPVQLVEGCGCCRWCWQLSSGASELNNSDRYLESIVFHVSPEINSCEGSSRKLCRDSTVRISFSFVFYPIFRRNFFEQPSKTRQPTQLTHDSTNSALSALRFTKKVILRTQRSFVRFPRSSYKTTSNYQPSHRSRPSLYPPLVVEIANSNGTPRSW